MKDNAAPSVSVFLIVISTMSQAVGALPKFLPYVGPIAFYVPRGRGVGGRRWFFKNYGVSKLNPPKYFLYQNYTNLSHFLILKMHHPPDEAIILSFLPCKCRFYIFLINISFIFSLVDHGFLFLLAFSFLEAEFPTSLILL